MREIEKTPFCMSISLIMLSSSNISSSESVSALWIIERYAVVLSITHGILVCKKN